MEKRLVKFCENSGNMFIYLTHCVWGKRQNTNQNQESENGKNKNWRSNPKSGNTLNYRTHCVPARRQNTEEKLIERGWVGSGAGQTSHFHPFLRLVVNISWCPKRPKKLWCNFVNELGWDKKDNLKRTDTLTQYCHNNELLLKGFFTYLIIVIFFTLTQFLENKIYTEKRQFFALNL